MKLREIMQPVSTLYTPEQTLYKVAEALAENHHSCGLICEFKKPIGIITERDIVRLFATRFGEMGLQTVPVGEVMTVNPICVDSETELVDALDLSRSRNLRHLPVVDKDQKLVGVVTLSDMVKAYLATLEQNQELKSRNRELHILSVQDALTGLPNRRAMEIDLNHAAAVALRRSEPYSIALIDLDYFKRFNDHFGHQAGDEALVHVARTLQNATRETDKLYRYGGEEFLLLMPFTPIEGAMIAAQRLGLSVCDSKYAHTESPFGVLTVSIGVAMCSTQDWKQVVEQADVALYDAKEHGRNTVCKARTAGQEQEHSGVRSLRHSTVADRPPDRPAPN